MRHDSGDTDVFDRWRIKCAPWIRTFPVPFLSPPAAAAHPDWRTNCKCSTPLLPLGVALNLLFISGNYFHTISMLVIAHRQCEGLSLNRKHDDSACLWKDLAIPSVKFGFKRLQSVFSSRLSSEILLTSHRNITKCHLTRWFYTLSTRENTPAKEISGLGQ